LARTTPGLRFVKIEGDQPDQAARGFKPPKSRSSAIIDYSSPVGLPYGVPSLQSVIRESSFGSGIGPRRESCDRFGSARAQSGRAKTASNTRVSRDLFSTTTLAWPMPGSVVVKESRGRGSDHDDHFKSQIAT